MRGSPSSTAIVAGTAPAARDGGLELARDREVARARQAVGDDRRLQRDDGSARVERLADRLAERGHYLAAAEEPTDGGDAAADDEAGDGRADQHLLLVLGDLLAPVGDLGHLAAQSRQRVRELHAVGLDRGADLLGRAGRHG